MGVRAAALRCGSVRVVGGAWGGRRLAAAPPPGVRPTPDMAREAVFNMLFGFELPAGATVIDCYAGTGAMGIEALSRGARHVTFVDSSKDACATIEENLAMLTSGVNAGPTAGHTANGLAIGTTEVVCSDVLTYLNRHRTEVDLAIADPPYGDADWPAILTALASTGARLVVAEADRPLLDGSTELVGNDGAEAITSCWQVVRAKRYGAAHVTVLQGAGFQAAGPQLTGDGQ